MIACLDEQLTALLHTTLLQTSSGSCLDFKAAVDGRSADSSIQFMILKVEEIVSPSAFLSL